MTFQTTDIITVVILVSVFIVVSVSCGIITYRIRMKKFNREKQNDRKESSE